MEAMSDTEVAVRSMLKQAGIPASEEEIASFVAGYPGMKAMVDMLYAVPEARYEAPALTFNPTPVFADWG
jgi:hypothetical protein